MQRPHEVYRKLYHYTTWTGLKGILGSQSLWATNYKHLNDYSEIVLFRDKLISLILPTVQRRFLEQIERNPAFGTKVEQCGGLEKIVREDAEVLVDSQYRALGNEVYITSFCGEPKDPNVAKNGLLSQWRAYGSDGGAALVFDTKGLDSILRNEASSFHYGTVFLADVVYSGNEETLRQELAEDINALVAVASKIFDPERIGKKVDTPEGYDPFVRCICRYKHRGFQEENEVRIVALPTILDDKTMEYANDMGIVPRPEKKRKLRPDSTPYIELFAATNLELPIEKVIIGPHINMSERQAELQRILEGKSVEIVCSDIPYVDR